MECVPRHTTGMTHMTVSGGCDACSNSGDDLTASFPLMSAILARYGHSPKVLTASYLLYVEEKANPVISSS